MRLGLNARLLGPRADRRRAARAGAGGRGRRASTPSGRPRPTAPTPPPCSPGSRPRPSASGSARRSSRCPARSPAMTAMTAATLDHLSGGRVLLGIGTSGPQVAEGWHGQRFGKQLARTREYVEIVRKALARERLEYDGEEYQLPLPDGPGKALKLMIGAGAGADPDLHRGDRAEEHAAHRRDRRRLAADLLLARARGRARAPCSRRAPRAPGRSARRPFDIAPIGERVHRRRRGPRPRRRCARSSRSTWAAWARARRTSTTQLVRRYGFEEAAADGPGPLPRRQEGRGRRGAARRADRHGRARAGRATRCASGSRSTATAGVGTLIVSPMAFEPEQRKRMIRELAEML